MRINVADRHAGIPQTSDLGTPLLDDCALNLTIETQRYRLPLKAAVRGQEGSQPCRREERCKFREVQMHAERAVREKLAKASGFAEFRPVGEDAGGSQASFIQETKHRFVDDRADAQVVGVEDDSHL